LSVALLQHASVACADDRAHEHQVDDWETAAFDAMKHASDSSNIINEGEPGACDAYRRTTAGSRVQSTLSGQLLPLQELLPSPCSHHFTLSWLQAEQSQSIHGHGSFRSIACSCDDEDPWPRSSVFAVTHLSSVRRPMSVDCAPVSKSRHSATLFVEARAFGS
jgi:hypothetical protein